MTKTIDYTNLCNESPETDPRLKRSDEKDVDSDITDKELEDLAIRKTFFKVTDSKYETDTKQTDKDAKYNDENNNSNIITPKPSDTYKLPVANSNKKTPTNEGKINLNSFKNDPSKATYIYKEIDPKYIVTSKPYKPYNITKNKLVKNDKIEDPVSNDVKEKKSVVNHLDSESSNSSKAMNLSNEPRNEANNKTIGAEMIDDADISNIRELRGNLLDHLLDYFLNIIKDEQHVDNDTRKRNGKDKMKVEEKLRNYYDPHHLDLFLVDDDNAEDSGFDDIDFLNFRRKNNEQNGDNNSENNTNIHPGNTTKINFDKKSKDSFINHESLQSLNKELNLKDKLNESYGSPESLYVDLIEQNPITSKEVNSQIEIKNLTRDDTTTYLNNIATSGSTPTTYTNEVSTTNRASTAYIVNEVGTTDRGATPSKTEATTADDSLNYLNELTTDRIAYIEHNDERIEDYIYDEQEKTPKIIGKSSQAKERKYTNKVTIEKSKDNKNDKPPNKKLFKNKNHSQIINNSYKSDRTVADKKVHLKETIKLNPLNKTIEYAVKLPFDDEDVSSENKEKYNLKDNKNSVGISEKITIKNKLIKNKLSRKNDCKKSIVLNLNINLV